ncbi:hypothetical protein BJV82DRAFT_614254 [Fennellomyces sp. T-0311]|nr:hypothetical protein BJV82DRAFT_614254 [Fennellomyces sp. T-0311]
MILLLQIQRKLRLTIGPVLIESRKHMSTIQILCIGLLLTLLLSTQCIGSHLQKCHLRKRRLLLLLLVLRLLLLVLSTTSHRVHIVSLHHELLQ